MTFPITVKQFIENVEQNVRGKRYQFKPRYTFAYGEIITTKEPIRHLHKTNYVDLSSKQKLDLLQFMFYYCETLIEEIEMCVPSLFESITNDFDNLSADDRECCAVCLLAETRSGHHLYNLVIQYAVQLLNSIIQPQNYVLK